ncbi:hypothetical protein E4K72_12150 [Oxalobacteraceae bacterium OM1]|nr:hypothetical protein E4K72_12150 [Oxalobacteraceae bacterium OM1]
MKTQVQQLMNTTRRPASALASRVAMCVASFSVLVSDIVGCANHRRTLNAGMHGTNLKYRFIIRGHSPQVAGG